MSVLSPPVSDGSTDGRDAGNAPILLVDDHALVAVSLTAALANFGIDLITIDPDDDTDLVALARERACELVLIDLDLGEGASGVERIPPLVAAGLRVVILSGTRDRLEIARAFEAGAVGYVAKRDRFETLVEGIRQAARGTLHHPADIDRLRAELQMSRVREEARHARFVELTAAERAVLAAICTGETARQIAERQFVAVSTIRSHIRGILTKLEVRNQAAAIALARDAGWGHGDPDGRTSSTG